MSEIRGEGLCCTVCDWSARPRDGYSRSEIDRLAIEHFIATGHTVKTAADSDSDSASADDRSGGPPGF